jgi:hypothetical protein
MVELLINGYSMSEMMLLVFAPAFCGLIVFALYLTEGRRGK